MKWALRLLKIVSSDFQTCSNQSLNHIRLISLWTVQRNLKILGKCTMTVTLIPLWQVESANWIFWTKRQQKESIISTIKVIQLFHTPTTTITKKMHTYCPKQNKKHRNLQVIVPQSGNKIMNKFSMQRILMKEYIFRDNLRIQKLCQYQPHRASL